MITDHQIRKLSREALTASQHIDCDVALGRREMVTVGDDRKLTIWRPTAADRRAARVRCAAVIKAHARKVA